MVPSSIPEDEAPDDEAVPFQTSVLISCDDGFILGASTWVADGTIFVATAERLPVDAEVDIAFVAPTCGETCRTQGRVAFWHDGDDSDRDRSGIGVVIG